MNDVPHLLAPIGGAEQQTFAGCQIDIVPAGNGRLKRIVYPVGHRWSDAIRPLVGTELCRHHHVGYLAAGTLVFEYEDGCRSTYEAPVAVDVRPGHDAYVVGDEPAVLVQVDFGPSTESVLGLPAAHLHQE
ncbi:MAG: hypothetical protein R2698_12310 [Microthrixaceae bacterium]